MIEAKPSSPANANRPKARPSVPAEGTDGLFTQSWFPICLSTDVPAGTVKGFSFLGGRVVVYRGENGTAHVLSAYCGHMGADLSEGCVKGNHLQCAFHMWEYDGAGACQKTGIGDPPPARGNIFAYPCVEKHGLIWAFNGETPLFDLPEWPIAEEKLAREAHRFPVAMPVDPWVVCAQTPDIQHIKLLHKFEFLGPDPTDHVEWDDFSMFYPLHIRTHGRELNVRGGIIGTSMFFQTGTLDGRWFGFLTGFGLPRPGETEVFAVLVAERAGDEDEARRFLKGALEFEAKIASEDADIARTMRFRWGALTRADATLAKFFHRVQTFPRANPGAKYIV